MELEAFNNEDKVVETEKSLGGDWWDCEDTEEVEAGHLGDGIKKEKAGDLGDCIKNPEAGHLGVGMKKTGSQSWFEMECWFSKVRSMILLFVQLFLGWLVVQSTTPAFVWLWILVFQF